MITASSEYYENLFRIQQDYNWPSVAVLLPSTEDIYDIDLNSRTITPPEFLGTDLEHAAEVIYFKCDRYYDYMDLSTCATVIQYENKKAGVSGLYIVPFVDIATCSLENKMLIPWCVDGRVTAQAGEVKFSVRFYKIDVNGEELLYSLTTLPATTKVLETMEVTKDNPDFVIGPEHEYQYLELVQRIKDMEVGKDFTWIVL